MEQIFAIVALAINKCIRYGLRCLGIEQARQNLHYRVAPMVLRLCHIEVDDYPGCQTISPFASLHIARLLSAQSGQLSLKTVVMPLIHHKMEFILVVSDADLICPVEINKLTALLRQHLHPHFTIVLDTGSALGGAVHVSEDIRPHCKLSFHFYSLEAPLECHHRFRKRISLDVSLQIIVEEVSIMHFVACN